MKILIVVAHPDDEVLGMGGTIKKLSRNNQIRLCVISEGVSAQYDDEKMILVRRNACKKASKMLGISDVTFFDFPDQGLSSLHHEINHELQKIIKKFRPEIVYSNSDSDLNLDHRQVFESCLAVCRPMYSTVKKLLAFEIPGHTKRQFNPNVYEDISKQFSIKIKAFKIYKNELMKFPHPRSVESIESFAKIRGIESGLKRAEAFELIRDISY